MATGNGSPVTRREFRAGLRELEARLESKLESKLKNYATKKDLESGLADVRADLRATEQRLAAHILKNSTDIEEIRRTMATKDDIDRIVTMIDGLMATYTACWQKLVVHDHRIEALQKRA